MLALQFELSDLGDKVAITVESLSLLFILL